MYYYNNYVPQMQRLQQMEQQFPQFVPNYPQNPQSYQQVLKGNPVTSIEEARASRIDLDGSLFIFPDVTNKKIYTKQINLDGTASLVTYVQEASNNEQELPTDNFLTRGDINSLEKQIAALSENMELIKKELINNAKSNSDDTNAKASKK